MSNINYKHNNIFIHNPKCAGTSMEMQDFVGGNSHAPAKVLKEMVGANEWETMFTWGFIRNPLDRFVSGFFHEPRTHSFKKNNNGFRQFVHFMYEMGIDIEGSIFGGGHHHHHFVPQYYFLCDDYDEIMVDYVGRLSTLEEDWEYISKKMTGSFVELPRERVSDHGHYSSYYGGDDDLVRMVKELYVKDYQIFQYF